VPRSKNEAANSVTSRQQPADSPGRAFPGFEDFYRDSYREVVKAAMIVGAKLEEADDAASKAFLEMLERWPVQGTPLSYARKAAVSNFIKNKTRGTSRVAQRLTERGPAGLHREGDDDSGLLVLEGQEWVKGVLGQLPPREREVMERIARGLGYDEIAAELGKSREVVRRRLCDARGRLVRVLDKDGTRLSRPRGATGRPPQEEIE
jgi:RNA polymerase sigma factor (sigma-70 family)